MSLYKNCKTAVSDDSELSSSFSVNGGVHQGSALNPLLFIMLMDVLAKDVSDGSVIELFSAGNLFFFCGESLNKVMDKYGGSKNAVERKGLRVNVDKKRYDKKNSVPKVVLCVIGEQVGCNSIYCAKCQSWVHCHCSDVPRQQVSLLLCWDVFVCRTCLGHHCSVEEK